MRNFKLAKACGLATALGLVTAFSALAQSQPSTPSQSSSPSATIRPDGGHPQADPAQSSRRQLAEPTAPSGAKVNPLLGLAVFSADGSRLGVVHSVAAEPDGNVKAIHIRTGGFLGFGGKLVAIPQQKFRKVGENIKLQMTADEVGKLSAVNDQS
jgi:sporulation protein YlmC with PRC-barrel domain